ncbi:MAG: ATP-binding cassette domain-containing protein [Lachnospiraceae bacterium]|nr:ATP-binding cassette domain-containing protein [Lachnospiraceae bacterium]
MSRRRNWISWFPLSSRCPGWKPASPRKNRHRSSPASTALSFWPHPEKDPSLRSICPSKRRIFQNHKTFSCTRKGKALTILSTSNLTKIYGSGENEVHAPEHVSLTIEKGEFVAIVGTSVSGKSTLQHMLGGLDQPTSGSVTCCYLSRTYSSFFITFSRFFLFSML